MDLGFLLISVCVMMICHLVAVHCSNGVKNNCTCPEIPLRSLTEPPPTNCFKINDRFRYTCIDGYRRKAGTSNLTKCKLDDGVAGWATLSLQCIPDPRRTTTQPPKIRETTGHTDIPHESTMAPTATAASTSLQMTNRINISGALTAERYSAEPTSPGLQVQSDHSQDLSRDTKATDRTTSAPTAAAHLNNSSLSAGALPRLSGTTSAVIALVSLAVVCSSIGASFWCYKRRTNSVAEHREEEEQVPMNPVLSDVAS